MPDLRLGALVDPGTHERSDSPVTLDTADFTTHGVIVGMTGSGKTGLGIVLIEEALSAGVPCLIIDPKGDLTNLSLVFPALAPADFRPWIDESQARRAGQSPDDFAASQAQTWKDGLAGWGIGAERLSAWRDGVTVTIYTPGSSAGVPVNIVGSLQAPADTGDVETMRDEIDGYVSGLLGLVGIDADPLSSREHILLANLIETSWSAGRSLDLATLVGQVQAPPMRKLGVFELDVFFPPADRTALALRLNGLLASPAFAAWASGPPLDIDTMLRSPDGRPCAAVVSIAHLSDEERQFVVALLLAKVVTWMRRQSGTTDLRALVYMDEVAGYLPPTANPPTKKPIMVLMKQARAFGVGVVLATQNPVDVDYKAISNAGTWMVGRLQTERDKARLLEGMTAAAGGVDVQAISDTISGLAKREFVLRRAGADSPESFTTRWAMSYLRGPLTRDQIATLSADRAAAPAPTAPAGLPPLAKGAALPPPTAASTMPPSPPPPMAEAPAAPNAPAAPAAPVALADDETAVMPTVADGVPFRHLAPDAPWAQVAGAVAGGTRLQAAAVARVQLRYDDDKADLLHNEEWEAVLTPLAAITDASAARAVDYDDRDLVTEAPLGARYVLTDAPIAKKAYWTQLQRDIVDHLVRNRRLDIQANKVLKLWSRPGESPEQFAERCRQAAEGGADQAAAALRTKYETRAKRLRDQQMAAHAKVVEYGDAAQGDLLSTAGSLLGSFLGGRRSTSALARDSKQRAAAGRKRDAAADKLSTVEDDMAELEAALATEIAAIDDAWTAKAADITTVPIPLEKADVAVTNLVLVWIPVA